MNITKHNPSYQLISVVLEGKEFVYSQKNDELSKGFEVYYNNNQLDKGHYYSRFYELGKVPMIYHELAINLSNLLPYCPKGHKLELEGNEYAEIVKLLKAA